MSSTEVPQVKTYLAELERALSALPRDRRAEVLRDIRAHIGGALVDGESRPAVVASVLDSLGTPQEIADAAYEEMPPEPSRMAGRDIAAVILLLVGGFLWGIGWLVGLILLWTSPAWRTRDKWIGTLVVPGGLVAPLLLGGLAFALPVTECSAPPVVGVGAGPIALGVAQGVSACTPNGGVFRWIIVTVLLVAVAAPFFTTFWLIRTARRTR